MNHHLIVIDGETLSQYPWNGIVVNLAATHHVIDMGRSIGDQIPEFDILLDQSFMVKLEIKEQMANFNREATAGTLDWWKTLPQSVQDQVKPSLDDAKVAEGLDYYVQWLTGHCGVTPGAKNVSVWCRGQDFDPILIRSLLYNVYGPEACDEILPYMFTQQRDIRTWVAAAFGDPERVWLPMNLPEFEHHNARHDVARSMIEVVACLSILQGNDVPDIVGE